jgi:hypothetical protein
VPAGDGYLMSLSARSVDGVYTCAGSSPFAITARTTTGVPVTLSCNPGAGNSGSVVVNGTTVVCAAITSLSAAPLEAAVGGTVSLTATATAGAVAPTFSWTATAGSFDNAAAPGPVFTCPATPGDVTITLNVSPSGPNCALATGTLTVTCNTLAPTFTNVYTNVLGARCSSCHRPGGSGAGTGMLDMSTAPLAYAGLVGVPAAGTAGGSSGVTCASLAPSQLRVSAGNPDASLLLNKVATKLTGQPSLCGSPMPVPATATPVTQAQVDLIRAWIAAGAPND